MNIIALAEKLAGEAQAPLAFDAERCLHSGDKFATCVACFGICPTGAIQAAQPPQLDATACERCFACLPSCPTGAYAAEDELPNLLRCLGRLEIDTLELVCQHHPAPGMGLPGRTAAIQVRGCLAGLGVAAYLQLAARPLRRVVVRTDACGDCPWQSLPAEVAKQVTQARRWLALWQRADFVEEVGAPGVSPLTTLAKRPVHHADAPPVSRRDLFRGRVPEPPPVDVASSLNPFHRRLRLLNALQRLPAEAVASTREAAMVPPDSGFAMLSVDQSCSACGTCARACPSGALVLKKDEEQQRFQLTFALQACLACEVCAHLCPEQAITVGHEITLAQLLDVPADQPLLEGPLQKCKRCNGRFAAASMQDAYCAVCDFRRKNPFGMRDVSSIRSEVRAT